MNIKEFIIECNKSPLFKRKGIVVTKEELKGYEFVNKNYELGDINILYETIKSPTIIPIKLPGLKKYDKDRLWHQEIIKHPERQQDIVGGRKIIGMPNLLSGFKIDKEIDVSFINGTDGKTDHKKYELQSTKLFAGSNDFRNWIIHMRYERHDDKIEEKIKRIIYAVLEKFKLPESYYFAIEELLLFNRIIPADPGLDITYKAHPFVEGKYEKFIKIEGGMSAQKIIELVKKEHKESKSWDKRMLIGESRRSKKSRIRSRVLELYALYRKKVNASHIADKIKQALTQEGIKIASSAIQKIIERE